MFKVDDFVVYKKYVCKIKEITDDYYLLSPINDLSLTINIPIDKSKKIMRAVMSKRECEELIDSIPNISVIETDEKLLDSEYKKLINSGSLKDLIKIIKTAYLINFNRIVNHKKIKEKDDNYLKKAEEILYNEIAVSLGIAICDVKEYISRKIGNK